MRTGHVVRDGVREAWRVARLGIIVKVTDHVHGQRYVLESDWVRETVGEQPFDEVYQVLLRSHDRSEMGGATVGVQQRLDISYLPQRLAHACAAGARVRLNETT